MYICVQKEYLKKFLEIQLTYILWVCQLKLNWPMDPSVEKPLCLFSDGHQLTRRLDQEQG